jgi:hypothetical protein
MSPRRFPPPWSVEETRLFIIPSPAVLVSQIIPLVESGSPGRGPRLGFFNLQSSRTLSKIAARNSQDHQSEMTTNPTTHKPRATVNKTIKNGILKI